MNENATPSTPTSEAATLRAILRSVADLIHRGLRELATSDEPKPPSDLSAPVDADGNPTGGTEPTADPNEPSPSPTTTTEPTTMPIGTKNFAFAHARIESDGVAVRVTKTTGFTPAITHPSDDDPAYCAPADDLPKVAKVRPADAGELPANTLLYRLTLPENHQIDRREAVVLATGANRDTHGHYRASAWAVNDRSVEVGLELRHPDVNKDAKEVFAVDVLVFRVD